MNAEIEPLDDLNDEALELLMTELGVARTARFLQQFTTGSGNYTEERKELFKDWTLEDVLEETRCRRENRNV
ncbi:hypothetical protein [Salinibacter sp.]|uniref:hypothetical protein n=1 Tax=Salinibacter sp. TaxID=2065818 RepID=UPI0021E77E95|nr:hypothetical protein [Salinibacter sp.]